MNYSYSAGPPPQAPSCYRHPDRPTYVRCTRCNRYICGECMRSAAVGHQCPDCVGEGARSVRPVRTVFGGRQPGSSVPVVTYTLIGLNLAVFVLQRVIPGLENELVLWPRAVALGDLYRLLTSAFLHLGILHILFNMFALYFLGPAMEMVLGRLRFAALYLLSALGGSALVYLLAAPGSGTAGASGAVFGLFGATFVVGRKLNMDVRAVVFFIVLNLVITFLNVSVISWQGHIGGLVTGAVVGAAYVYAPRSQRALIQAGASAAVLVGLLLLIWWRTSELRAAMGLG
ncbi:rhomboid family intramembrane serine protease [Mycolicibacterium xanthum]|uniref:rhomboid family intramembrane serine protease n=1 Tax=Mycolicibacterium xanthum TaxID=2796469 RepID=UPI0027E08C12|nr:rhomboid family intramembrane serine protease [Mycolicibacterium xanthum]